MPFSTEGRDDYAVIIGLQNYPGIDNTPSGHAPLQGPENDAEDFYSWVISKSGGNLPIQNVSKILSSNYPPPTSPTSFCDALPAVNDIIKVFEKIRTQSSINQKNQLGSRVGRRLYIFMSGHGIAPTMFGSTVESEAGLLMCNVPPHNRESAIYHIPGGYTANWFCQNDCFEQIFLFMDCCRDSVIVSGINMFFPMQGSKSDTTRFYALSTRWSQRSREKNFDGRWRGIFTKILLDGLNGGSAVIDPKCHNNTVITGRSLKNFLYSNMNKKVNQDYHEPDIDYYPKSEEGEDILIKDLQNSVLATFPIEITVPSTATGCITIHDGNYNVVHSALVKDLTNTTILQLTTGKYLLTGTVTGLAKSVRFEVLGTESEGQKGHITL